jgi:hypothetical protein
MAPWRIIVHCPQGQLFAMGCTKLGIKQVRVGGGEMTLGNCIWFYDDTTFDALEFGTVRHMSCDRIVVDWLCHKKTNCSSLHSFILFHLQNWFGTMQNAIIYGFGNAGGGTTATLLIEASVAAPNLAPCRNTNPIWLCGMASQQRWTHQGMSFGPFVPTRISKPRRRPLTPSKPLPNCMCWFYDGMFRRIDRHVVQNASKTILNKGTNK